MWRTIAVASATSLAASLAGCAGAAAPTEAKTNTIAAIRSAREVGAERTPQAAYHLELAQEQLARAEQQIQHGRMQLAQRSLERARADADLAIALTREASVEEEARDVRTRIEEMRERHL